MREIKFRGIDEKGVIRIGLLSYSMLGDTVITEYSEDKYFSSSYLVSSETVGQYTGLKDKNGNDIYEGDILACPFGTRSNYSLSRKEKTFNFPIIFESGEFKLKIGSIGDYRFYPDIELDCGIIGNIHEHSNLLS